MTRPSWDTLKGWGRLTAKVVTVLAVAAALYGFAWGIDNAHAARDLAQTGVNLSRQNLRSQNNHHEATVKADQDIENAEGAIAYEGGVITYLLGEITQQQQAGHQTLAQLQSLQQEINVELPDAVAALRTGQAQINAYLEYLTCLNLTTDPATCGTAPPLPST